MIWVSFLWAGKLDEGLKMFQETLKLEEEVLGENHPFTFETLKTWQICSKLWVKRKKHTNCL
ncbi:MAG: hypothetical protein Ct9H300mP21_05290 [Pseudomonadota bacterium]|nr:MAG: hypothetical protein Ct9H300mP21_05290 [Pseudomonadota bacterium]